MIGLPFLTRGRKAEAPRPDPRREPPVTAGMTSAMAAAGPVEPSGTRHPASWFGELWAGNRASARCRW